MDVSKVSHQNIIDIIGTLKAEKQFLYTEFGVLSIGLFGSFVRGEQQEDSDLDILVELEKPNFDRLSGLLIYLEKRFGKRIELIRKNPKQRNLFIKKIEKDVIYA